MSDETTELASRELYDQEVADIINRSKEAWDGLIERFGENLRLDIQKSLHTRRLPTDFAEDIEQETWLRALRKIENFVWEDEEKFYHWLRAISLMCIYELKRSAEPTFSDQDSVEEDTEVELERLFPQNHLDNARVEDQVILRESMMTIERALTTLNEEQREIFVRWLMGERPRMLAIIYHKPANTMSQLLKRALKKVKSHLEDDNHE